MAKIDFVLQKFPDKNYKKESTSVYNLLNSMTVEFDTFLNQLDQVKNSKFVDYANGNDLDKLGIIINVTRYYGESDSAFRGRIKATIPSFIGGGTLKAISTVVESFLGVSPMIIEHYTTGNGRTVFDNGISSGNIVTVTSGLGISISPGYSYINGTRITSPTTTLTLSSYTVNRIDYIYMQNNGTFIVNASATTPANTIPIASISVTSSTLIQSNITDKRFILDPFTHSITNTASISVQIPYDFNTGFISVNNVKDILKKTKAAGIALLITIVQAFNDTMTLSEVFDTNFIIGFSQLGDSNLIGGT